jgi:hypothetical protein
MAFAWRAFLAGLIVILSAAIRGAFRPLSTPRIFLNQRPATMSIRQVNLAQQNYSAQHPSTGYACDLSNLGEQGTVDRVLSSGTKAGYHSEIQCAQRVAQKAENYTITAVPLNPWQQAGMRCVPIKREMFGTAKTDWSPIALLCANRSGDNTDDFFGIHFTGNRVHWDLVLGDSAKTMAVKFVKCGETI